MIKVGKIIVEKGWKSVFLLLLVISIGLGLIIVLQSQSNQKNSVNKGAGEYPLKSIELPAPIDHPNVQAVFLHYLIAGPLKELKDVPQGKQLILEGKEEGLPPFIISPETRIAKISPPYGLKDITPLSIKELIPGVHLSISIEYDPRAKLWFLRDIFVPTNLN